MNTCHEVFSGLVQWLLQMLLTYVIYYKAIFDICQLQSADIPFLLSILFYRIDPMISSAMAFRYGS